MKSLKATVQEYLNLRRSLGYKLRDVEPCLSQFLEFLRYRKAEFITTALALEWATSLQSVSASYQAKRLSTVRIFAQFRKITDPRTEIPPHQLLPYRPKRAVPHIYSDEEILRILNGFLNLRSSELSKHTQAAIFGLLAITGGRAREILSLSNEDVDFERGYLTIRNTKFGKSRIVPLHPTTLQALKRYTQLRDSSLRCSTSNNFFVSSRGNPIDYGSFKHTFIKLSKKLGLRGQDQKQGPRVHDLRHTLAVKTILTWYRSGANVEAKIPLLSTYLGHTKPSDTYWYLSAVPELLDQAVTRLETISTVRR